MEYDYHFIYLFIHETNSFIKQFTVYHLPLLVITGNITSKGPWGACVRRRGRLCHGTMASPSLTSSDSSRDWLLARRNLSCSDKGNSLDFDFQKPLTGSFQEFREILSQLIHNVFIFVLIAFPLTFYCTTASDVNNTKFLRPPEVNKGKDLTFK